MWPLLQASCIADQPYIEIKIEIKDKIETMNNTREVFAVNRIFVVCDNLFDSIEVSFDGCDVKTSLSLMITSNSLNTTFY